MAHDLEAIPEPRRPAADAALKTAFGARPVGPFALLKGGVSGAGIYCFEVDARPYVLRLEPERIPIEHRQRGFTCMAAAAAAGVAPPVHYADASSGAAVMDFITGRPLAEHPGGRAGVARELGRLIARLQTTPPFPLLGGGRDLIEILLAGLAASALFEPGRLDRHIDGLARIREAYPWDPSSFVSSHNDPNPRNLLSDGRRLWLVDWELASLHDPLFDLAILTMELAATPELQDVLLTSALGRPPDAALRARLTVVRQLARLFYGCIVLEVFATDPRFAPDPSLDAFTPAGFATAVTEGRLASGAAETAYAFGKMSLAAFVDGLAAPEFAAALAMVRMA